MTLTALRPYALDHHKVRYHPYGEAPGFLSCRDKEVLYEGPAGCVAGETRLFDPSTGEHTPIVDLWRRGIAPVVLTLFGPVRARVPFRKGVARLYRVRTESGRECIVTDNHRMLTPRGWRFVRDLAAGVSVLSGEPDPLASGSSAFPQVSLRDAGRWSQKLPDSSDCYDLDHRQGGGRFRLARGSDQALVPSRSGALARIHDDCNADALAGESAHSRPYQPSDRRAMTDCFPLSGGTARRESHTGAGMLGCAGDWTPFGGTSPTAILPAPQDRGAAHDAASSCSAPERRSTTCPDDSQCAALGSLKRRVFAPSEQRSAFVETSLGSRLSVLELDACSPSFAPSKCNYRAQWDKVQSIEYERTDEYFDLHVPGAEHYLAEGLWHHNTGKSYACLWKLHAAMLKYPGSRALMVRKTLVSLTASALVTFVQRVLTTGNYGVTFFGGSKAEPAQFRYPNGSRIVVGGMDNPAKIMSAEYDVAYVNEATELTENDWESITTRLRFGVMPYQQLIADCNPSAPSHWLNQRANLSIITRFGSRHEDNPVLWDHDRREWTERGIAYMETLDRLTGVRYQRLRLGQWVAAEGQVYDSWRDDVHILDLDREAYETLLAKCRYRFGTADWGWTNPGVLQAWGVDYDGRLYLLAEVYQTRRPVESWWIPRALDLSNQYDLVEWVCDPAEPQYIAQFNDVGLNARPALNDILPGINAVQNRLAPTNGTPRLFFLKDALQERDEALVEAKQPWSTVQEIPEYVWAKNTGGETLKDRPVDANNHGLDAVRYAVAHLDLGGVVGELDPAIAAAWRDVVR